MNKTLQIIVLVALLAILALGCTSTPAGKATSEKPVVKIGVIVPLSGENAQLGAWSKQGVELALRDIRQQDTKYQYKVIYEDDQFSPRGAATAANKLVSVDNADVIISLASSQGNAVKPIAAQSKIMHFGVASDGNVADGQYNFIHWTPPAAEAKKFLQECQKRGIKRVAMLGLNHQGVIAIEDEVIKQAPEYGVEIVYREHLNSGTTDFRTPLIKAQQAQPDLIFPMFFDPEIGLFMKQYKESGITAPVSTIEVPGVVKDPSIFEGMWYINAAEGSAQFAEKFRQEYGTAPGFASPNVYDITKMTVAAYEAAGQPGEKPSQEQVAAFMRKLDNYDSAMGKLRMQPSGIIWSDAEVFTIKNGQQAKLE